MTSARLNRRLEELKMAYAYRASYRPTQERTPRPWIVSLKEILRHYPRHGLMLATIRNDSHNYHDADPNTR